MAIIDSIKNKLGAIIYPKTLTKAVYEESTNKRLDNLLNEQSNKIDILNGLGETKEKANKTDLDEHKEEKATEAKLGHIRLSDIPNIDISGKLDKSGDTLESYREKLVTLSGIAPTIDLALSNVFTHTLSGNTTYSITNAQAQAHSFTLIITQGVTVRTITFPASIKWQGGEIPDLSTANKVYYLLLDTIDSGVTWHGRFGGMF